MNFFQTVTDIILNPVINGLEQDVMGVSTSKKVFKVLCFISVLTC